MEFEIKKIDRMIESLQKRLIVKSERIAPVYYIPCGYTNDNIPPAEDAGWLDFDPCVKVGGRDCHLWLHFNLHTPVVDENFDLQLKLVTDHSGEGNCRNPQTLAFVNGKIVQGMDYRHKELLLEPDKDYDIYLYVYMGMFEECFALGVSLEWLDKRVEKLYYDLFVACESGKCLGENNDNCRKIFDILSKAVYKLDFRFWGSEAFYKSVDEASKYLEKNLYNGEMSHERAVVNCVGSTHIDVAWLWTVAQSKEKVQRSFATVLNLMKQYPEYKFMSSQPQIYKYVKEYAPELYEEIKKRVAEGRWEIEGAMWLESDCNVPSGESLVRQILVGKKFIKDEFDVDSKILYLPDVFGYSAALPQILRKSGIDRFITSKISWSEFNKFPYDSFMWQGIDGTEIFTSFITGRTNDLDDTGSAHTKWYTSYGAQITPTMTIGTWERYQQKAYNNEVLLTYGYSDGGGGPTKDMLEQQRRLGCGLPGMPKTQMSTLNEYLDKAEKNFKKTCDGIRKTPRWVGELYLERHRATYTTMARNKRWNRESEQLLQKTEMLSVFDDMLLGGAYPFDKFGEMWEKVLLNQFHDILPGSSIEEVYEVSAKEYGEVLTEGNSLKNALLNKLADNVCDESGILLYNPNSFETGGYVNCNGQSCYACNIPPLGWRVATENELISKSGVTINGLTAESSRYIVKLDEKGDIIFLLDKQNDRQLAEEGKVLNQFRFFENCPAPEGLDAWDMSVYYDEKMWLADEKCKITAVYDGARSGFCVEKTYSASTIKQNIWLSDYSDRIDFETTVDWKENFTLLKVAFPFALHPEYATYDIQFGSVNRPVHTNTSWDVARFEVCGQKWADVSEDDYGVSILNNCKYGYSVKGGELSLTLLTSPSFPNPNADREIHNFTYSIYPHKNSVRQGGTVKEAYKLNLPIESVNVTGGKGKLPGDFSFVKCSSDTVVTETIKKAESGEGIILRMYQSANVNEKITLDFGFKPKNVYMADLMENKQEKQRLNKNSVTLPIKGFEIVTLFLEI